MVSPLGYKHTEESLEKFRFKGTGGKHKTEDS